MERVEGSTKIRAGTLPARGRFQFLSRAARISSSQVIRRSARFLFLFIAARKLGPELFGIYALLLAIVETLSLVSGEGSIDYLAREVSQSRERAKGLFWRVTQLRWAYALLLLPPTLLILHSLKYPSGILIDGAWLMLTLFARAPLAASQGLLRGVHRATQLVWLEAVQGSCLLAVGLVLLSRRADLSAVIWAEVISCFAAAFVSFPMVQRLWQGNPGPAVSSREVLRATFAFNLYPLIANIYDRIDVILLSALAGNLAAGVYALPYRALATLQILPFGLMAALLPSISTSRGGENDRELCSRMLTSLYVLSLFPVLIVTLLAKPLVLLVLGKHFAQSVPILRILIWATIPMFVNYGLNTYLLARGKERVFLLTNSVCAVVNVLGNILLIPHFSYFAAAALTMVTEIVLLVQHVMIIRKDFGFVALPNKVLTTSLIFVLLVAVGLAGSQYLGAFVLTAATSLLLLAYLYFGGTLRSMLSWTRASTIADRRRGNSMRLIGEECDHSV